MLDFAPMDAPQRRTAALAALEAHRRKAEEAGPTDQGSVFAHAVFAYEFARQLTGESLASASKVVASMDEAGDHSEGFERALAVTALNLLTLGNKGGASKAIDRLLTINPSSPSGMAVLAEAEFRAGNDAKAREILQRARDAAPGHPFVEGIAAARAETY